MFPIIVRIQHFEEVNSLLALNSCKLEGFSIKAKLFWLLNDQEVFVLFGETQVKSFYGHLDGGLVFHKVLNVVLIGKLYHLSLYLLTPYPFDLQAQLILNIINLIEIIDIKVDWIVNGFYLKVELPKGFFVMDDLCYTALIGIYLSSLEEIKLNAIDVVFSEFLFQIFYCIIELQVSIAPTNLESLSFLLVLLVVLFHKCLYSQSVVCFKDQ